MEWYLDDLVVPRDQELLLLDRLPSPNGWSRWGVSASESLGPTNYYKGEQSPCKEVTEMDFSVSEAGYHSNLTTLSSRGFEESSDEQGAISYEEMEQELNHLAGMNQMDDISFLPFIFLGLCCKWSAEIIDSLACSFELSFLDHTSLASLVIMLELNHFFSPKTSLKFNQYHVLFFFLVSFSPAPLQKVSVTTELEMNEDMNKEASLEVSVLQELERVMVQLPVKTRICFRDALYRLATNSKQHLMNSQNGNLNPESLPPSTAIHDQTPRLENTKNKESKTNVIDRAVANLMFCKMNSNAEDRAVLPTSGLNIKQEATGPTGHWHLCSAGDAEVPIFG
ncbi:hypothetical protein NMG60_11029626 [Bertholletia excelsa]